jgi:hypothetical protein
LGSDPITNTFGIVSLTPFPADATQETAYVRSQNLTEVTGTSATGGNGGGSGFVNCALTL